ncbi:MAG: hypothetical protein AAGH19_03325 [Pseudomonadota bacterium]
MSVATARKAPGRWHVTSRVVAAILPAFILTNTAAVLLALALPGERLTGAAIGTFASFLIYVAIIMWVFSVERLRTVWLGLTAAIIVTGGGAWLLYLLETPA